MNALIITDDKELQEELADEVEHLRTFAKPLTLEDFNEENRQVGLVTKILLWITGPAL